MEILFQYTRRAAFMAFLVAVIFMITSVAYVAKSRGVQQEGLGSADEIDNCEDEKFFQCVVSEGDGSEQDNFPVVLPTTTQEETNAGIVALDSQIENIKVVPISEDKDLIYIPMQVELPLQQGDYYYGKYENGRAGAYEINKIPVLYPGDSIRLIGDGYITVKSNAGYIQAPRHYFGSGLCWSTSTLGQLMDYANIEFNQKYGINLFLFPYGRYPHSSYYKTYASSNNGFGYTVIKKASGSVDYGFQINPKLANHPELYKLKLRIVLTAREDHPSADHGQSLGGYILSNVDF